MSDIQNIVKNIQNIMRKDAGVDGDAQRISQLVWMLFLKIFDDREKNLELIDPGYHSPIPEELRWRAWAADPEGMTGEELFAFIDKKLFPTLKGLAVHGTQTSGVIVKNVFIDTYNYMKNGTLIRQVVNKINEINFNKKGDRHAFGDLYEKLLKDLQSAGNAGEFYTPRPLTKFIVEMVAPELGETVLDPACGTGGFLVNVLDYIRASGQVKTADDEKLLQSSVHGVEVKPLPHLLATTNFMLHDVENPFTIRHDDMLARPLTQYGPQDRVDVIVANPPFGGVVADGTQTNFPRRFQTKDTALLFLVLFVHLLKDGGRAGIVLPDGVLFGEGVAGEVKKELLEKCNVHTIVRLPQGVFNPYAGVNTNLIFFTKGEPTKEIWYYQLPLPKEMKQYTKNRGITHEEFDVIRKWWGNRKSNSNAWKVSIKEIQERNYNLDFKNPNGNAKAAHKDPKEVLESITDAENKIAKILEEIK
ncbi:SAM-dependent DNA methyltransferase, partial [Candidatus Kaiserbacteria bacterium]|nr:SAM-dependent DNA methyltransferase [Candidatus Kaiserbacteria bacterium]